MPAPYPEWAYEHDVNDQLILNYYGRPIISAEYFEGRHETREVLPMAGFPPECVCGWTRERDPRSKHELIDHQRDQHPDFQPLWMTKKEEQQ